MDNRTLFCKDKFIGLGKESSLVGLQPTLNLVKVVFVGLSRVVHRIDTGALVL